MLFNLEAEGYRNSRTSNPAVAVLEQRIAALEGGVGALCLGSGQAAVHGALLSLADVERLIDAGTMAVYCENVGNPAGKVCDIEALARVAHAHGVSLMIDNTVASPVLLRPFEFGADIVIHSLTKFLGG